MQVCVNDTQLRPSPPDGASGDSVLPLRRQKRHDGFLSNFEVRDLLMRHAHSEKQAKQAGEAQSSARSEHRWLRHHVLEYLDSAPAKRTRAKDIQRLVEELRACEQRFSSFRITPSEIMQLANLRPKESVVAHLVRGEPRRTPPSPRRAPP